MENRKIIAEALLEVAQRGHTDFIEDAAIDKEIKEAAKKVGIELPSPDLMVMKTVYAEIDKVNLNGVVLPKKAVEKGLSTLIGKQCNWEHDGAGFVCGYTIDAKIKEDKIETINVIFKSLFPDQADELKEKVKSGEAAVSFEIWNINPETKESVVKDLANGYKEISPIIFHGTGVLLVHEPACPKAKIFKLVAKNLAEETEKCITNVFSDNLVYASLAIPKPKCTNCGDCTCKKEDNVMGDVKKLEVQLPEETKTDAQTEQKSEEQVAETETATAKVEETKEEPKVEEPKVEAEVKSDETPKAETEAKVEEPKVEEKTEGIKTEVKKEEAQPLEQIEPKVVVKVTSIYSETIIDTFVDGTPSGTQEIKGKRVKITEYKDGTKDEVSEDVEIVKKYDFAESEAKNKEIADLKTTNEELDKEIKKLQKELEKKSQEIAELKNSKVEEPKEKELTVGSVENEAKSEIKRQAEKVNEIISEKHNQ